MESHPRLVTGVGLFLGLVLIVLLFFVFGPKPPLIEEVGAWLYHGSQTEDIAEIFAEEKSDDPIYLSFRCNNGRRSSRIFAIDYGAEIDAMVVAMLDPRTIFLWADVGDGFQEVKLSPSTDPLRLQIDTGFLQTWADYLTDAQRKAPAELKLKVHVGNFEKIYEIPITGFSNALQKLQCFSSFTQSLVATWVSKSF